MNALADSISFWTRVSEIAAPVVIALMAYLGVGVLAWIRARRKPALDKPLRDIVESDIRLFFLLDRLLDLPGAMRASISRYHNGEKFLSGTTIVRINKTHERVRSGISFQAPEMRDQLLSLMPEETKLVLEKGTSWTLVSDVPYGRFRTECERSGTQAVSRSAIYDVGRKDICGFIGLDFDVIIKPADLDTLLDKAVHDTEAILNY